SDGAPARKDSAPEAGAEDPAEHAACTGSGPVHGLRQRKAVGVVGKPHRPVQVRLEIALERLAVKPRRIGVLHQAARRRHRAWNANPDASLSARALLEETHHVGDGAHGGPVVVARRWSAMLAQGTPVRPKCYACDLGAAQIDANARARAHERFVGHAPWPRSREVASPMLAGATARRAARPGSSH